jgi:hypothetical protein
MVRQDLFTLLHEGLRTLMYSIGSAVQSADFSDTTSLPAFVDDIGHALELLEQHARDEDQFVFPPLTAHAPHSSPGPRSSIEKLTGRSALFVPAFRSWRQSRILCVELGEGMNLQLNELLAFYLSHLCFEENVLLPASWEACTDDEIMAIRGSIQNSMPPERYADFLRLMLPSANNFELVSVLTAMKASAPPPALQSLVTLAEHLLPPARVTLIRERAGV